MPVQTHDKQGRPYIKLADIKEGTKLQFDESFGCLDAGATYTAGADGDEPYVICRSGVHGLTPQAEHGYCIGVYAAEEC